MSFAEPTAAAPAAPAGDPIGRVTAAFGAMSIEGSTGKRGGDLQSLLFNDDNIVTDTGGVTVLLASRVVLKIDANSCVAISEGTNQTNLVLERGTVQVFVGQRPANAGTVVLRDVAGRAETVNGVFLASYDPGTKTGYYACERSNVTLSTGDGSKSVALTPDTQATIEAGVLGDAVATDRVAFAARKLSVDRLGQSAVRQTGSDTFRLRSRTLDMEVAISQLSAAGWIDKAALTQLTQQSGVLPASSSSSSSSGKSTAAVGQSQAVSPAAAASSANVSASGTSSASAAGTAASAATPSVVENTSLTTTLTQSTPTNATTGVPTASAVSSPAASTTLDASTPAATPAAVTTPEVASLNTPAKIDIGNSATPETAVPASAVISSPQIATVVPKVDVDIKHDKTTDAVLGTPEVATKDKGSKADPVSAVTIAGVTPQKADLGLTRSTDTVVPKLDTAGVLTKDNTSVKDVDAVNLVPKVDVVASTVSTKGEKIEKIDKIDKVELPKSDIVVPKVDTSITRDASPSPVKADIGIAPVATAITPKTDVDLGSALKDVKDVVKIDLTPKVDVVVPKAEVVVPKADVAPKADVVVVPKADVVVVPKVDVAIVPKVDIAPPAAPVKADIGITVPAPVQVAPPVTIDIVPKNTPAATPAADVTGLKDVLKDVKDVVKTDVTKIDVKPDTKTDLVPAVKDVKIEAPTIDVKPTDLPTPKDIGVTPVDTKIDKIDKIDKVDKADKTDATVKDIVNDVLKKDVSNTGSKDTTAKPAK